MATDQYLVPFNPPTQPFSAFIAKSTTLRFVPPPQVGASQQAHPPSKGGNPTHLKGAAKVDALFIAAGGEVRIRTRHTPSPTTQPTYQTHERGGHTGERPHQVKPEGPTGGEPTGPDQRGNRSREGTMTKRRCRTLSSMSSSWPARGPGPRLSHRESSPSTTASSWPATGKHFLCLPCRRPKRRLYATVAAGPQGSRQSAGAGRGAGHASSINVCRRLPPGRTPSRLRPSSAYVQTALRARGSVVISLG